MSVLDTAAPHRGHCFFCTEAQGYHIYIQQMSPLIRAAVCETKTARAMSKTLGFIREIEINMSQDGFITDVGHVFSLKIRKIMANTFFFTL